MAGAVMLKIKWEISGALFRIVISAIEKCADNAYAYFTRGIAKRALEDYGGAMKDFLKAVELDAGEVKKYFNHKYAKTVLGDRSRVYSNKKNLLTTFNN